MKKINCKHGLNPKEEIQARRLRVTIESAKVNSELRERIGGLYKEFKKNAKGSFYDYIKENDVILYSALERSGGIARMYDCLEKQGMI